MTSENKRMLPKILAPIIIVMVVAGIWVVKNFASDDSQQMHSAGTNGASNPDFVLVTKSLDLEQLKSYGLPVMINFGSNGCAPCRAMFPVIQEINAEYQGKVIVKFADVWEDKTLAEGFPLDVIPTQFFFTADGKPYKPSDPDGMGMMLYTNEATGEHIYTAHKGSMTKEMIVEVFQELGVGE